MTTSSTRHVIVERRGERRRIRVSPSTSDEDAKKKALDALGWTRNECASVEIDGVEPIRRAGATRRTSRKKAGGRKKAGRRG